MALTLEATYFRTGLLLGVLGGEDVHRWAERIIEREATPPDELLELVLVAPTDLSALRHALWPLTADPEPPAVLEAILALLHADLGAGRRDLPDTVTVVRQMRSMLRLPPALYAALNEVLVGHAGPGAHPSPLPAWLGQFAAARLDPLGHDD